MRITILFRLFQVQQKEPNVIAKRALQEISTTNEDNIRILKNNARKWFADYIAERNKVNS